MSGREFQAGGGLVGVVVIGRNEGGRLRRCLASIDCTATPVIYVDSGSTDGSVELARSMGALVHRLDATVPFTAARARNEGWQQLQAAMPDIAYFQFVDGDCEVEAGWLARAGGFLDANPAAGVVCGRRRERFPDASPYNAMCDEEWNTPVGKARECGGDSMMRVGALLSSGGFNPGIVAGEEPELCARLRSAGWGVWRIDTPMTIHDAAMLRFSQWWTRAIRSGYGYAQTFAATRRGQALYRRELIRAAIWGALVPAAAAVALFSGNSFLAGAIAGGWLVQSAKVIAAHGRRRGALLMVAKPAEFFGACTYLKDRISARRAIHVFAYK